MTDLLAQIRNPVLPGLLGGGARPTEATGGQALGKLISSLIGAIFTFAFLLAFVYLLAGGIQWITNGSDKGKLEEARNKVTHALVGLVIVASSWAIMKVVSQFLGLNLEVISIPTVGK